MSQIKQQLESGKLIHVGQRIHCILNGGTDGVVTAIHGVQDPGSCQTIASGIGVTGGGAHLDIVWDDGTESRGIPESLARTSVQWKIYAEVASMSEVVELKANLAIEKARRQAEEDARQVTFNKECDRLRQTYPQLIKRETESSDFKRCLVNVRIILKESFSGIKFSVRQDSFGSLTVRWTDGPTEMQVGSLVNGFKGGSFDGMEDIYRHERTPWNTLFGEAKYLSLHRTESEAIVQKAIDTLWDVLPNVRELVKPTPASVFSVRSERVPGLEVNVAELIRTLCSHYDAIQKRFERNGTKYGRLTFVVDYACKAQGK